MKYDVEIEGKKYKINVNRESTEKEPKTISIPSNEASNGDEVSYEIVKCEYDYCVHRSEKLDNKIYILITVCAFLSPNILGTANDIIQNVKWHIKIMSIRNIVERALLIGMFLELFLFVLTIILLITTLLSINIYRFDQHVVLKRDMFYNNKRQVLKYVSRLYSDCTDHNNQIISKRYKLSNYAIVFIAICFVLLILLRVIYDYL